MELRYYQNKAVEEVRASILNGSRKPLVVLSTGSGKSIIFAEIVSLASCKGSVCLFLVHRRNLVYQFKETLLKHYGIESGTIMAGEDYVKNLNVYVGTVQTYSRRLKLGDKWFIPADIVLCDEAHLTVSKTYVDIFNKYKTKIIIGTTATPSRADGKGLGEVYDSLLDIIQTKELTEKGYLAKVKYIVPSVPDLAKIRVSNGEYDNKELGEKFNDPKLVGDVVSNWLEYASDRKTIVFSVNVKHSLSVCEAFNMAGIRAVHLDAKSPQDERDEAFRMIDDGEIQVICNVALYVEGMDVPDISCVVLAMGTKSIVKYRQCVGRGLRVSGDFDDLMLIDHGGCYYEHGSVGDDICWSLDGNDKAVKEYAGKDKEKKSSICRSCKQVFEGLSQCPDCGTPLKSFGKPVEIVESKLVAIDGRDIKSAEQLQTEKRIYLGMLKFWVPMQKNPNPARVNGSFRGRYGVWPHHTYKDVAPIKPDKAFLAYQKHLAIKYFKSKQKVS